MRIKRFVNLGVLAIAIAAFLAVSAVNLSSQQGATVQIDNDDIGGMVDERQRPGSGRLGDRRDQRFAD